MRHNAYGGQCFRPEAKSYIRIFERLRSGNCAEPAMILEAGSLGLLVQAQERAALAPSWPL